MTYTGQHVPLSTLAPRDPKLANLSNRLFGELPEFASACLHHPRVTPSRQPAICSGTGVVLAWLEALSYRRFGGFQLTVSPGRRTAGQGAQNPRLAARTVATISSSPPKSTRTALRPNANSSSSSGSPVTVTGEPLPTATTA
jgi:hypothetical protein